MATWEIPGPGLDTEKEVLRSVAIISAVDRGRSKTSSHRVRVGIRRKGRTSWLGTWDQATHNLNVGVARSLLSEKNRDKRIRKDQTLVLEIKKTGTPTAINGTSVHFQFSPSGGVDDAARPLISSDTARLPDDVRQIVDSIIFQTNAMGALGRRDTIHLTEPTANADDANVVTGTAYEDEDTLTQTVNSTSYVDGTVSAAVVLPSGARSALVHVTAGCTFDGNAAAGTLYLAIGDGTTDHNENYARTAGVGFFLSVSTSYAVTITADMTFKTRFKYGAAAMDVDRQHISASVVEFYA